MAEQDIYKIVLIGAGNLATSLFHALIKAGKQMLQVVSRNLESAKQLASSHNVNYTNHLEQLNPNADLYILAVNDDALTEILQKINITDNQIIVHTAGGIDANIFDSNFVNYGVFYPLQTFSKQRIVSFTNVPVLIEGNTSQTTRVLINLAECISKKVIETNSIQRSMFHLAAVFSCNFINHLFAVSEQLLHDKNLEFKILEPLIHETIQKAMQNHPASVQTGPAIRNDHTVINKHLQLLEKYPEYQSIYQLLSDSIYQNSTKQNKTKKK